MSTYPRMRQAFWEAYRRTDEHFRKFMDKRCGRETRERAHAKYRAYVEVRALFALEADREMFDMLRELER